MSSKLFFPPGNGIIPQPDFETNPTENGGLEATQSFLIKKASVATINGLFTRGKSIGLLDPNCPSFFHFLGLKKAETNDYAPGVLTVRCTFTGYGGAESNGSSGNEPEVPTYSLRKDIEEVPLNEHRKWEGLSDESKKRLGLLLAGGVWFFMDDSSWGSTGGEGELDEATIASWPEPTGDELQYARLIAQGRVTFKRPAWTWTVRTEGSKGFTNAQLNSAGKIVNNPQGNPPTPSGGYVWFFVGPDQEQSGDNRFVKDLTYQLIPDTEENQFLYGP